MALKQQTEIRRCAIYTRKSVEDGLEQEFNSLDAQREAGENFVASQKGNGWVCLPDRYDDGGFSGGNTNRPALRQLIKDAEAGKIDIIVVYKIDRLSRSICDFAELSKQLDKWSVAFVSVTQEINTQSSSGRMMLNILITFAQFEREVITERVRDKMAASRLRGKWVGGNVPLGYKVDNKHLAVVPEEAVTVRKIFNRFIEIQSPKQIALELNRDGIPSRSSKGWDTHLIYRILNNYTYIGKINYKGTVVEGEQVGILDEEVWKLAHDFLKENAPVPDHATRLETMAPLKGILRCGHCDCAMVPVFTRRGGRKYCYYRCSANSRRAISTCPVKQVPAGEIETITYSQLALVLQTPEIVLAISQLTGIATKMVAEMFGSGFWDEMTTGEKQRLVELLVENAIICEDGLTFEIKTQGVKSIIEGSLYVDEEN